MHQQSVRHCGQHTDTDVCKAAELIEILKIHLINLEHKLFVSGLLHAK